MEGLQNNQLDIYRQIQNLLENFKKSPKERLTRAYLETRLDMLESYWEKMQTNHEKIVAAPKEEKQKLTYLKSDVYDSCLDLYLDMKTRIKEKLSQLVETSPQSSQASIEGNNHSGQPKVKLPPILIPKFSGDYKDWLSFHDLFKSLVHDNSNLSTVSKCHYLKSSLQGEAETLVKQMSVTESNYQIMWDILNKRYNNRRHIVNAYIGKLINQKRICIESSKAIKELLDTTAECLTSLKAINVPTEFWDDIVVYIVIQKLDTESHKYFEQRIESLETLPTWNDLAEFLEVRFRTLEAVKYKDTQPSQRNIVTSKSFAMSMNPSIAKCVYCNDDHRIYTCKNFSQLSVNDRQQFVQKNNMCFNCLSKGHAVRDCTQFACRKCGRMHHTLLHGYSVPASQSSQITQKGNIVETVENIDTIENIETIDSDNKIHSLNTSTSTSSPVLLATALVAVQSNRNNRTHTLRALVDQGSQTSLITESACRELGLKTTSIIGDIVGVSSNKTVTKALVEFEIMSRHDSNVKINVSAYVLKSLTSYIPQRVQSVDWPQLETVQLADPTFLQPGRIDLLLGAEVFAEIIQQGLMVFRDERSSLVAQGTKLGWIVSGRNKSIDSYSPTVFNHHLTIDIDSPLHKFCKIEKPCPVNFKLKKPPEIINRYNTKKITHDNTT